MQVLYVGVTRCIFIIYSCAYKLNILHIEDDKEIQRFDLLLLSGNGIDLILLITAQHIPILVFSTGKLDPSYAHYVNEVMISFQVSGA